MAIIATVAAGCAGAAPVDGAGAGGTQQPIAGRGGGPAAGGTSAAGTGGSGGTGATAGSAPAGASGGGISGGGGTGGTTAAGGTAGTAAAGGTAGTAAAGGTAGTAAAGGTGGSAAAGGMAGSSAAGGAGANGRGGATGAGGAAGPSYPYIFSCFNDSAALSSLMIYTSNDALNFTLLYDTKYTGPTGFMRDPSIMRHTDGKYYVAFTTPPSLSCCGPEQSFGIASSSNLKDWTTVTQVPCGVAGTTNTWAPEWFRDDDGSLHVLVTLDAKTYRYEPTDATLTKWGSGTFIGIGPGAIDTFVRRVGGTYHAFAKNGFMQHATATSLDGPWKWDGVDLNCKEAPAIVNISGDTWRFYCDNGGSGHEKSMLTTDLFKTWTPLETLPGVGNDISHGTVLKGN